MLAAISSGPPVGVDRKHGATRRFLSVEKESSLRERLVLRDERALVELIDLATPWLLGVTQSMLSDPHEAEEIVLEAFHIAWNKIDLSPEAPGGLMPWLMRVTRNRAIDRLRAHRRYSIKAKRAEVHADADELVSAAAEPNEAAQPGWRVHDQVRAAIADLPVDQRKAVDLAFFRGLTHSEIAEELGIPLGTVKTRLRLAFGRLRTSLSSLKDWMV